MTLGKHIPFSGAVGIALRASMGLLALAAVGCAGNNSVVVKEKATPTGKRDFTSVEFLQERSDVQVPQEVELKIKTETSLVIEKFSKLGDYARSQSGDKSSKTVHVRYKVKSYDAGQMLVRKFLGMFGLGVSTLEVEARYYDDKMNEMASTVVTSRLAADTTTMYILASDNEQHAQNVSGRMFDYWYDKFYLYGKEKNKAS